MRLTNRLTRALHNSFPHVLQWLQEQETVLCGDFLSRWPPLTAAQRARRITLEGFGQAHHGRSAAVITARIEAITNA